jgi:hypothetical protein
MKTADWQVVDSVIWRGNDEAGLELIDVLTAWPVRYPPSLEFVPRPASSFPSVLSLSIILWDERGPWTYIYSFMPIVTGRVPDLRG